MSEIAKAHTLVLQFKASQRFPSMLKNTLRALVGVFLTSYEFKPTGHFLVIFLVVLIYSNS